MLHSQSSSKADVLRHWPAHIHTNSGTSRRVWQPHFIAERSVRHGRLLLIPARLQNETHAHDGAASRSHLHVHVQEAGYFSCFSPAFLSVIIVFTATPSWVLSIPHLESSRDQGVN